MITDCTRHYAVYDRRMLPIYPSWGMRTTMVYSWTLSGHLWVTRNASKAIPSRVDISLIASGWTSVSDKAICCIKVVVVAAWVRNCNTVSKVTPGRFLQLIHVKRSTVLDSNVVAPLTAVV